MENKKQETNDEPAEEALNYAGIKAMPFIIGNETFEKLGTVGSSTNLAAYLTTVLGMDSVRATMLINIFNGSAALAILAGAFLSDAYFGRYRTMGFACVTSFLGTLVLTLTTAISNLHPPKCVAGESSKCVGPTAWHFVLLLSAFGFLVIGAGGIRACSLGFGADQFNPNTKSGKRGITTFFNLYYLNYTFAVMVSQTLIVFVQSDVSWAAGLAIPAFFMFLSCVVFFLGRKIYVIAKPQGSPLTSVAQVLVAAARKRGLKLPKNPAFALFNYFPSKSVNSKLPHTDQFRFLDKAAIITVNDEINWDGSATNPWRLCSIQQVEEVKCWVRVVPIWASTIISNIPIIKQHTYAIRQALQLDRSLGTSGFKVPTAAYIIIPMLTVTIWLPIYGRILVPYLRNLTGKGGGLTLLQRMGIGNFLSILCMLVAGLVEGHRKKIAFTRPTLGTALKGGSISSMSGFWLVPQLVLAGLADSFNFVAQTEFYFKQFPENTRSIGRFFFFSSIAVTNYLSGFLVSIVHHATSGTKNGDWLAEDLNRGKLDCFYYMIAGMGIPNFIYFLVCAKWYRYRVAEENQMDLKSFNPSDL